MATFTSAQVAGGRAPSAIANPAQVQSVYGAIDIAANPTDGDIYQLVRLPAGATVVGGYLRAEDLDTGTETLDIDLGWAANGVDSADPDGFGNLGLWSGDAVTDLRPEAGIYYPLGGVLFSAGPKTFTVETIIQAECNTTAATGGTGYIWAVVDYIVAND